MYIPHQIIERLLAGRILAKDIQRQAAGRPGSLIPTDSLTGFRIGNDITGGKPMGFIGGIICIGVQVHPAILEKGFPMEPFGQLAAHILADGKTFPIVLFRSVGKVTIGPVDVDPGHPRIQHLLPHGIGQIWVVEIGDGTARAMEINGP